MTLVEGQGKVIQYISPDLHFLSPKYLRFNINDFNMRSKTYSLQWMIGWQKWTENIKVTPDRCDLIMPSESIETKAN